MQEITKAYWAYASVSFFWGTTYLAIRIGAAVMPPALFAGIRFLLAGVIMTTFMSVKGKRIPRGRELFDCAVVGISLLTIGNGLVVISSKRIESSMIALIIATLPIFIVIIETFLPNGPRMTAKKAGGMLLGFLGIVLLLRPDTSLSFDSEFLEGTALALCATVAWGSGSLYSKYRPKREPMMTAAMQMLIAGLVLCAIGLARGETNAILFSWQGAGSILYLIVFGSIVGFGSYIYALTHLPASTVTTYAYLNPIVAVSLGWLILDERLDWWVGLSTAVILTGVLLVNKSRERKVIEPKTQPERLISAVEET